MSRARATMIGALAAATAFAWSGPVAATGEGVDIAALGPGYTASDAPLGAATPLRLDLKGRVPARCDLAAAPAPLGRLDLLRSGAGQSAFRIDCNTPFVLRVSSSDGGFANPAPTPGVESLKPYQISLQVGTDDGVRELGWCDAASIVSAAAGGACPYAPTAPGGGWSSGESAAIGRDGLLRLRWAEATNGAPLLGDYRDIIVIELEVRS